MLNRNRTEFFLFLADSRDQRGTSYINYDVKMHTGFVISTVVLLSVIISEKICEITI